MPALRAAALVAALTLLTNAFGFVREIMIATTLGASREADILVSAFAIVSAVFLMFSVSTLQAAFMPVYQALMLRSHALARGFFRQVHLWLALLLAAVSVLLALSIPAWVDSVLPGFDAESRQAVVRAARWLSPMVVFVGLGSLLQSVSHAHGRFLGPALVPLGSNLAMIACIAVLGETLRVDAMLVGYLLGSLLWLFLYFGAMRATRGPGQAADGAMAEALRAFVPLVVLLGADQVSAVVQKTLVSGMAEGTIAAISYAAKLEGFPVGIFALAIATGYFPSLSSALARGDTRAFAHDLRESVGALVLLTMPVCLLMVFEAKTIVAALLQRGAFDARATDMTAPALAWYSLGLVPQALIVLLTRLYFAARANERLLIIGLGAVAFHIVALFVSVDLIGYLGVAAGTTAYAIVFCLAMLLSLPAQLAGSAATVVRALRWQLAVAMIVEVALLLAIDFQDSLFGAAAATALGAAGFFGTLLLLRDPDLLALPDRFLQRRPRTQRDPPQ